MKLSKKTLIIIIIASIVVASAVIIPVCVIFVDNEITPKPEFYNFNQESSYSINVKWNKIRKSDNYTYQYCFGNPIDDGAVLSKECKTENCMTTFDRHKGIVGFRVKANIPNVETSYSEWIILDVESWKLDSPVITINPDNLKISWTDVKYKEYDVLNSVPRYAYNASINGTAILSKDLYQASNILDPTYFIQCIVNPDETIFPEYADMVYSYLLASESEKASKWVNTTFEVKVKSLNYNVYLNQNVAKDDYLYNVYDDSEYGYVTLTITRELFDKYFTLE